MPGVSRDHTLPLLLLQCHASHDLRVLGIVASAGAASPALGLAGSHTRTTGAKRRDDRLVVVHAAGGVDAAVVLAALLASAPDLLVNAVQRAYAVDAEVADFQGAVAWMRSALQALAPPKGVLHFRAHTHPRSLEASLADALDPDDAASDNIAASDVSDAVHAPDDAVVCAPNDAVVRAPNDAILLEGAFTVSGAPCVELVLRAAPPTLRAEMSRWEVLACVAEAGGSWYVGVARGAAWEAWRRGGSPATGASSTPPPLLCRAQRKLQEVGSRVHGVLPPGCAPPAGAGAAATALASGLARGYSAAAAPAHAPHPDRVAVDLGAAPGGWAAVLAAHHAFVFAVDPGSLRLDALPASVAHDPTRAGDAVPRLLAGGLAARVSTLVCDANVPCAAALGWLTSGGIALLAPGAALVLTLKNFEGGSRVRPGGGGWRATLDAAEEALRAAGLVGVSRLHLLSNAPAEVTLTAFAPT